MNLTIEHIEGDVGLAILGIEGDLDASNYRDVIAKAREAYDQGTRYFLIDMNQMSFMSSSGLVALHVIVQLLRGEAPPEEDSGWGALRAVAHDRDSGAQRRVKLLNPQPIVSRTLEKTGMTEFFEIYTERAMAVASF